MATDNHVGYAERDAIRGDDSWKSFHEVMCVAKEQDVDMVLLAGDLFHDNKPSRKAIFNVMRSLRMNCYGEKPCELEMLSDSSEVFTGYEISTNGSLRGTLLIVWQSVRPCQLRGPRHQRCHPSLLYTRQSRRSFRGMMKRKDRYLDAGLTNYRKAI